jgi:4-hydroxy-3-polyprenylbenzoate decarboxylase
VLVTITGASGAVYGIRTIEVLIQSHYEVHTIVSRWGEKVIAAETGEIFNPQALGVYATYEPEAMSSPVASGSFHVEAMIIVPCSMNTVGSIASGLCTNLIHRAALVTLKEGRPLVIVPRETPLSLIDLRNLTKLAEAGAVILPASPAFYYDPHTIEDTVDFIVGKIMDRIGIEHHLFKRWQSL